MVWRWRISSFRIWQNFTPPSILARIEITKEHTSVDGIVKYFKDTFPKVHKVEAGLEFEHNGIVGHPDLVVWLSPTNIVIFDVKVFAMMNVTKSRAIRAQLASYVALARSKNLVCDTVGVIMPWQRDPPVKTYSVKCWNSSHLLNVALSSAEKVRMEPAQRMKWTDLLQNYNVGSHVHKDDAWNLVNSKLSTTTPFQIFLYGNNPSPATEQKGRKTWEREILKHSFSSYNAFVHAPYNLNLASEEPYVISAAKMYLRDAANFGFKGVVFHVGHHKDPTEGVEIMERNLNEILLASCPETPFILETPCGSQNELLSTPEEFGEFLLRFKEQLLGGCLDTCHVFVSGYSPMEYLEKMKRASERICLIHFNGSRKKKGCRADGHSHVTYVQNIPDEELVAILEVSKEWNVCSVTE